MKIIKPALVLGALFYASASSAVVLDFETFAAGTIIDDEYFTTLGVSVSALGVGGAPDVAVVFDSNDPSGNDDDLGAPFAPGPGNTFGSISPGNLLILHQNDTCDADSCGDPNDQAARPAGTMSFSFSRQVFVESLDFFDIEGPEIGDVVLYGDGGVVLDTLVIPDTGGDRQWARLLINIDGVTAMDVNMGGSGAIDNLQYAVPLPAGLPLLLGALGALGLTRRRKT